MTHLNEGPTPYRGHQNPTSMANLLSVAEHVRAGSFGAEALRQAGAEPQDAAWIFREFAGHRPASAYLDELIRAEGHSKAADALVEAVEKWGGE